MLQLFSTRLCAIALTTLATFVFTSPAWAAGDLTDGKKIFEAICVTCHQGGQNLVNPAKTLEKENLEKHGKDSIAAIVDQVNNGKNAMPAFDAILTPAEMEDVASYVLEQAEQGW